VFDRVAPVEATTISSSPLIAVGHADTGSSQPVSTAAGMSAVASLGRVAWRRVKNTWRWSAAGQLLTAKTVFCDVRPWKAPVLPPQVIDRTVVMLFDDAYRAAGNTSL
jgi:hypothetical protein